MLVYELYSERKVEVLAKGLVSHSLADFIVWTTRAQKSWYLL